MTNPCTQEENIGFIKGKIEQIFDKFMVLDKRLNGSFNQMTIHVSESTKFRNMMERHEIYFRILAVTMLPVVIYLIKELIKHVVIR